MDLWKKVKCKLIIKNAESISSTKDIKKVQVRMYCVGHIDEMIIHSTKGWETALKDKSSFLVYKADVTLMGAGRNSSAGN